MHPFRRAVIRITVPRGVVRSTGVSSEKARGAAAPSPNAAKYRSGPWKGAAETNFLNARLRSTNSGGGQPRSPHEAAPHFEILRLTPTPKASPTPRGLCPEPRWGFSTPRPPSGISPTRMAASNPPAPLSRTERNPAPSKTHAGSGFLSVLLLFSSERRHPAKKLIAERNNYSEEEAAEISVAFLGAGGECGLVLFRPDCGIHDSALIL